MQMGTAADVWEGRAPPGLVDVAGEPPFGRDPDGQNWCSLDRLGPRTCPPDLLQHHRRMEDLVRELTHAVPVVPVGGSRGSAVLVNAPAPPPISVILADRCVRELKQMEALVVELEKSIAILDSWENPPSDGAV